MTSSGHRCPISHASHTWWERAVPSRRRGWWGGWMGAGPPPSPIDRFLRISRARPERTATAVVVDAAFCATLKKYPSHCPQYNTAAEEEKFRLSNLVNKLPPNAPCELRLSHCCQFKTYEKLTRKWQNKLLNHRVNYVGVLAQLLCQRATVFIHFNSQPIGQLKLLQI